VPARHIGARGHPDLVEAFEQQAFELGLTRIQIAFDVVADKSARMVVKALQDGERRTRAVGDDPVARTRDVKRCAPQLARCRPGEVKRGADAAGTRDSREPPEAS
jgi:hypothetical protein